MFCSSIRSGTVSIICLYCTKKALAMFDHTLIWSWLNRLYHLVIDPVRLSWKQWMSNLSLLVYPVIFRQYIYRWADGHFVPSYLSKVGTLNFGGSTRSGTKLIVLASTKPYTSDPSTAFRRSSMSSNFRWASLLSDCSDDSLLNFSFSFGSSRSRTAIGSALNSAPLHLPVSVEEHSYTGILRLVALVGLAPCKC